MVWKSWGLVVCMIEERQLQDIREKAPMKAFYKSKNKPSPAAQRESMAPKYLELCSWGARGVASMIQSASLAVLASRERLMNESKEGIWGLCLPSPRLCEHLSRLELEFRPRTCPLQEHCLSPFSTISKLSLLGFGVALKPIPVILVTWSKLILRNPKTCSSRGADFLAVSFSSSRQQLHNQVILEFQASVSVSPQTMGKSPFLIKQTFRPISDKSLSTL